MTNARTSLAYRVNLEIVPRYRLKVIPAVLRTAARAALRQQAAPAPSEVTLLIAGSGELRRLNRDFLGHDYPTDVLSFPSGDANATGGRLYLGDIAIAYPQALKQARSGGHSLKAELQLLVVHGVLHLLGHDHAARAEKARMWTAQAAILSELKAAITGPSDDGSAVR